MRIDPRELHGSNHDLIVIGAGIQGAAIAREAALRGLGVLLVDARDIAAGTSSRSSRLVHGGLRYLRDAHFGLVREALGERERLLRLAPHLVRPVPMVMPFFKDGGGSALLMRLGTALYARMAGRSTLPGPRSLSAAEAAAAFPGLRTTGLRRAIEFFDAATQDARLCLANVLSAHAAGALVATHCAVVTCHGDGLHLVDGVSGAEIVVQSHNIVNAAGPRADAVRAALQVDGPPLLRQSRGSHIVLPPRAGETALAAFLPDGRIQFVIPHQDGTLCGTTEVEDALTGDETGPPTADLEYLLAALKFLLEPAPRRQDVQFAYAGWRALPRGKGPPGAQNREAYLVDEGLLVGRLSTVVGGKLTTHRALAERVIAKIFGFRDASPTRRLVLPGGDGPRQITEPLWWRHGSRIALLHRLMAGEPSWRQPLCAHRPFLAAELALAVLSDGAVTFADAMLRRLVHSCGPCLEESCLRAAHALFLRVRRWPCDDDADDTLARLRAEVLELNGDLRAFQAAEPTG